jgi:hypothetical protein
VPAPRTRPSAHAAGLVTTTQSTASWVADLRGGPRHWVTGTSAPCTSIAKPVRVGEQVDVDPAPMPTNAYDPAYRWWRHERLHRLSLRDHPAALGRYGAERDRVEKEWLADPPDTATAFAEADRLEEAWLGDLVSADLHETRPGWLRRKWHATDRVARMPGGTR